MDENPTTDDPVNDPMGYKPKYGELPVNIASLRRKLNQKAKQEPKSNCDLALCNFLCLPAEYVYGTAGCGKSARPVG